MSKHTPAPWRVYEPTDPHPGIEAKNPALSIVVWGRDDEQCGIRGNTKAEALANAHLIAAAPFMFDALISLRKAFSREDNAGSIVDTVWVSEIETALDCIDAAIAKATGAARPDDDRGGRVGGAAA